MASAGSSPPRNPLLGAAVLKMLLRESGPEGFETAKELYRGVLRDLQLTDAEVDQYLVQNRAEVEKALGTHRGGK
jgi:hypothetical protein